MAAWDTLALIASAKRRASVPTSQATLDQQGFLDVANEELQGYVVPIVIAETSRYLLTEVDQILAGQTTFRMPTRAVGGKLANMAILDTTGNYVKLPQIGIEDLDQAEFGGFVKGNTLNIWNRLQPLPANLVTLRLSYYQRPNTLVLPTAVGVVQSILGSAITLTGTPPAGFVNGAVYDLVRAQPGFECLNTDLVGNTSSNTITMSTPPSTDLAVGDYVCLAKQAPVAQIPLEFHPLLQQALAVKILQSLCDFEALAAAEKILMRMEADARALVAQRIDGEPPQVVARTGLMRLLW